MEINSNSLTNFYVGTSGFQFDDWIGTVYPKNLKKSYMFDYYVKFYEFNAVEINYTFYTLPNKRTFINFASKVSDDFKFVVKLHSTITHDMNLENLQLFFESTQPLIRERKLLGFLAQFPYSFKPNSTNISFLSSLNDIFQKNNLNLFIEFRHNLWTEFLVKNISNFNFVIPDLPNIVNFPNFFMWAKILKEKEHEVSYFRFHGRNQKWFEEDEKRRYNYDYSDEELKEFLNEIKSFNSKSKVSFFNNCFLGKALKNAVRFKDLASSNLSF